MNLSSRLVSIIAQFSAFYLKLNARWRNAQYLFIGLNNMVPDSNAQLRYLLLPLEFASTQSVFHVRPGFHGIGIVYVWTRRLSVSMIVCHLL
jgi:hypothetical protein